jgi:hypothetical protein
MSNNQRMMSFEEFRVSEPTAEVLRQQEEHFREPAAAEALLQPGALPVQGWPEWPELVKVTA